MFSRRKDKGSQQQKSESRVIKSAEDDYEEELPPLSFRERISFYWAVLIAWHKTEISFRILYGLQMVIFFNIKNKIMAVLFCIFAPSPPGANVIWIFGTRVVLNAAIFGFDLSRYRSEWALSKTMWFRVAVGSLRV